MNKEHNLLEELKNNGIKGVIKRLFYYIPNHYVIYKVKKASLSYGLNKEERKYKIIVSLTSYPPRFNHIYLCLKSLLCQNMKPDKIIVWLGSDTSESDLTDEMKQLQAYGVEYRYDKNKNLMSHKKYFYAMQEFPDDIIITVDDDSVYPENTIRSLYNSYLKHPRCISARRVHKMTYQNGILEGYDCWKKEYRKQRKESNDLIAIGVGGILYPPHSMPQQTFDIDLIKECCIGADDIWLKCMEVKNSIKVVWVPCFFAHPPALEITGSLWQGNVIENNNDVYLQRVSERCNINLSVCKEE